MAKFLGIDPGTRSFDFCGLEDDRVIFEKSIPSIEIAQKPELFIEAARSHDYDLIVGPSGYGLPLKRLGELDERDFFLLTLVKKEELGDVAVLKGMQLALGKLRSENVPMYFIPGVIHLPTVPHHRKLNKVDMGTADKLCCAALGMADQAERLRLGYDETSFIIMEVGFGYTASIAVQNGKIIDGIGGTGGAAGFVSIGSMDSELAYLLEKFKKASLFSGGAYSAEASVPELELLEKSGPALDCLVEACVKNILTLRAVCTPKEILLSGRLTRIPLVAEELEKRLAALGLGARKVQGFAKFSKEAAQGAAIVANGLGGGKYEKLIDCMRLREASGTCLDYITINEDVKRRYGIS